MWPLEALNGLLAAERRRRISSAERATLTAFLRELPVRLDVHTAEQAWDATRGMAERFKLTIYDAAYLELAQRRRLPLASLDEDLRAAAVAAGVEVLAQGPLVAERLQDWLVRHPEMETRLSRGQSSQILTTDDPGWFGAFSERVLGHPCPATKIRLTPLS